MTSTTGLSLSGVLRCLSRNPSSATFLFDLQVTDLSALALGVTQVIFLIRKIGTLTVSLAQGYCEPKMRSSMGLNNCQLSPGSTTPSLLQSRAEAAPTRATSSNAPQFLLSHCIHHRTCLAPRGICGLQALPHKHPSGRTAPFHGEGATSQPQR